MISCFSDLGELCWHIKRLWYIAECRQAWWFAGCSVLGLQYEVFGTRELFREGGVCKPAELLLANAGTEHSGNLNVKQLHLNLPPTLTLWHIYCSLQCVSLVCCCLFTFLPGNVAFDPWYLVYKVLPHAAHGGSNDWQQQQGEATLWKVKPSRVLITWALLALQKCPRKCKDLNDKLRGKKWEMLKLSKHWEHKLLKFILVCTPEDFFLKRAALLQNLQERIVNCIFVL